MVKLRHVSKKMTTTEGKKLAEERHIYMRDFFARLDLEIKGKI
jgi:HD superfamily phosphodiesterase